MVKRMFTAVYKEVRGLHQAAYVLAVFTFGSQLLALVRDRLLAHQFGAGIELDLYYSAFRIPDLLYVLFASTLSVYVLIPFVAARMEAGGASRAREFLSQMFSLFVYVYVLLAALVLFFAPSIVAILFPGFGEYQDMLVLLVRVLMLQPLLLGISSLYGVITQYNHRFILYALSPLVYNLGIIVGLLFMYPFIGIAGLVWGVVLGALTHLLIQLPFILKSPLTPTFVWPKLAEVREVFRVSVPRAVTLSLHQLLLLGLIGIASVMATGSVAVFQFAFNLQSVPLAIIGVSYSVAAFPILAQLYAEKKFEAFSSNIIVALRHIIFWSMPVIALLVVIRAQFVRVILGSGAFDWDDTRLTAAILALFAISLTAQAIHLLIVRALYAAGNTRLPFYTTLFSSVLALVSAGGFYVAFILMPAFRHFLEALLRLEGVVGTEVIVLPLGYSFALIVHVVVLLFLSRKPLHTSLRAIGAHIAEALTASFAGGAIAYLALNLVVDGIETSTLMGIFLQGLFAGVMGVLATGLVYYLLRSQELFEVYRALHKRIRRTDVVAPQSEDHLSV